MKTLSVGIGCRLHSSAEQIEAAVRAALGTRAFDQIRIVASVDTKADEAGLLAFCARHSLTLQLFSRERIAAIAVANPSAVVREHLGVDGVCEPCALLAASAEPGAAYATPAAPDARTPLTATDAPISPRARLLVPKTLHAGVTVAIAATAARAAHPSPDHNDTHQQDLR
ncbi:cobalamin biosynthesis protein CbiG [Paraburkholderia panacisoli]|uniref:Cobalamin biosynthesis protein CbiG n=1 Tax=Paraburkholderia panacisoli TaxID=2603818 RepID=A0A5B0GN51_9BURK|nr:cobalamin biosynthesis protein [Paraburkholderia panacisoli]KAA1004836.1 cobalamin biosynthesis protein CbiG [Paraburkholderia panacisoli]